MRVSSVCLATALSAWHPRTALVTMAADTVTVCQGGSCATHGGVTLYAATCVLAAGCDRDAIDVKLSNCCGECPDGVIIRLSVHIPSYVAQAATADGAADAAEQAITATGATVLPAMRTVFHLGLEADRVFAGGSQADAIEAATAALAAVPAALLDPWQTPLEPEALSWEGTKWEESIFGSPLELSESTANFEFGTVGKHLTLVGCEPDGPARALSGEWEGGGGAGTFALTMSEDGRFFHGTLSSDADGERAWEGMRLGVGTGMRRRRRGAAPPPKAAWLHDLLLRRARLHLAVGAPDLAFDDARRAVVLCCRTTSGYALLAQVAEACGDAEAAEVARREKRWLDSFA